MQYGTKLPVGVGIIILPKSEKTIALSMAAVSLKNKLGRIF
jgi:hypothetical protein